MSSYRRKKEVCYASAEEERHAALKKAMDLLLYRDRSTAELTGRLREAGFREEVVETAINSVSSYGYLNDRRFAETFAATRAGRMSRVAISLELKKKGVDDIIIREVLEGITTDEGDLVYEMLKKRAGALHPLDDRELRRITGYLARKGFSSGDIWRAVRRYQSLTEL